MDHHHHHDNHHHDHGEQATNRTFFITISLTLLYVVIEIGYGFITHSMSLLADAVHNLGDSIGLLFAWFANWLLTLPARKRYSYGFKRMSIISALVNAIILIVTSILIAIEAVQRLFHTMPIHTETVVVIALLGILVNGGSALLFMKNAASDLNLRSAFLHLFADACILLGVIVSTILIHYTHLLWLDPAVSLVIIGIILYSTLGLLKNSFRLMLDAVPQYIDEAGVTAYLASLPGVKAIHDLHIWGLSTREVALTAHLVMPTHPLTDEAHQQINEALKEKFHIHHATLQIERGHLLTPCVRKTRC